MVQQLQLKGVRPNRKIIMSESKIIIVSNRLPIKIDVKKNGWQAYPSEGGLATGLGSIYKEQGGIWIGWPGATPKEAELQAEIEASLKKMSLIPVFLTPAEVRDFYEGFSNQTLWPLFHYFPPYATFNERHWETYEKVNQKFADAVLDIAEAGDTIWLHDYQLMLVPQMIRAVLPDISIGYFQHIPFPSYEVFRLIPWRNALLTGLLGADLIGFHTHDDVRHFISAILRILDVQSNMNVITFARRLIMAESFPMGIDYDKFQEQVRAPATRKYSQKILERLEQRQLIISIDRLDYSKGIIQRLNAISLFLKNYPAFRGKVVYFQLIVPSRDKVREYDELKQEIDKMVSNINAEYSTLSWQPIQYFYRSWAFEILTAIYYSADIALVTPMRDGMNLVCKEYVASKTNRSGVLILSEMAGAARELTEAVIINPNDVHAVADEIHNALLMPEEEKIQRMNAMRETIKKFNIHLWVKNFLMRLTEIKKQQNTLKTNIITKQTENHFEQRYLTADNRLIFLDYDGTLVPFNKDPNMAVPGDELHELLGSLCADPKNKIVLISGRSKETLESWLGDLPLDIIAEHGAWTKEFPQLWQQAEGLTGDWKIEIMPVLELYEMRTPGSFIEEKDFSLAWHYRKVESSLGELRAKEIAGQLKFMTADRALQVLDGHKVIEIKSILINKGKAAEKWLKKFKPDFALAIGDDMTDEDTFKAMPQDAITIKVGGGMSEAHYFIDSPQAVLALLRKLSSISKTVPLSSLTPTNDNAH